jgi:hypothetical protein
MTSDDLCYLTSLLNFIIARQIFYLVLKKKVTNETRKLNIFFKKADTFI